MGEWVAKHEEEGAQVRHGSRPSQAQTGSRRTGDRHDQPVGNGGDRVHREKGRAVDRHAHRIHTATGIGRLVALRRAG